MMKGILLKITLVFLISFFLGLSLNAQTYKPAIGARLGYPLSVSYKTFISQDKAIEIYAGFRNRRNYNWTSVNVAYQKHLSIKEVAGLNWYFGAGAGLYFWNDGGNWKRFFRDYSTTTLGIHGYLGLDYTFSDLPINLILDWIPTLFLGDGYRSGFGGEHGSLGVRYIFE